MNYDELSRNILLTVSALAWLIVMVLMANAHSWYSPSCCSGTDCAEIPASSVKTTKDGYDITLAVGQHPMLKKPVHFFIKYSDYRIKRSQDENYHACISSISNSLICFYEPAAVF